MQHWLDRVTSSVAPRWTLRRQRARIASNFLARSYDAASNGRRTMGWRRSSTDANLAIGPSLARLRDAARDLVRNNPHAESALATIADHTVGWGIFGKPATTNQKARDVWKAWAESTDCDADGRNDFYGLQKLVMRTVAESGECLVRRRIRRPEDGFALPIQLQILEPDFIDTTKEAKTQNGGVIVQGVEFDPIGRRVAYYLFRDHPGSNAGVNESVRVPADGIRHIFKQSRPGQVRAPSWFAPVLLRFKDFDDYEDATLVKQKVAACLAVITTDPDGTAAPLGTSDDTQTPPIDNLSPGAILNLPPGKTIEVVQPPSVTDYDAYARVSLRAIATGLGVAYEDLTGDYQNMPFSAARMSMLRHWARVEDWRWRLLIPQFCEPAWAWAMQMAMVMGLIDGAEGVAVPLSVWTPPPAPMVDPVNEGLAYQRNIRAGIQSLSEALRERGLDPDDTLDELASDFERLDKLKLVLDCDPRNMTQAGQLQGKASAAAAPAAPPEPVRPPNPDDVDDENNEDEDDNEDEEEE